jgi:hypothetical protein
MRVVNNSSAEIIGIASIETNGNKGIAVRSSSNFIIYNPGSVTVKDTIGEGIGIMVAESSVFDAEGGTLTVDDNNGSFGVGIYVQRSSHLKLKGSGLNAQIKNNQENGIILLQHSSGRFDAGTQIFGNGNNGLWVTDNSQFLATNIQVTNNDNYGIKAEDGSSANCSNSTITGNSAGDIRIEFEARSTLNGNTLGTISCDTTALSRGSQVCP